MWLQMQRQRKASSTCERRTWEYQLRLQPLRLQDNLEGFLKCPQKQRTWRIYLSGQSDPVEDIQRKTIVIQQKCMDKFQMYVSKETGGKTLQCIGWHFGEQGWKGDSVQVGLLLHLLVQKYWLEWTFKANPGDSQKPHKKYLWLTSLIWTLRRAPRPRQGGRAWRRLEIKSGNKMNENSSVFPMPRPEYL